MKLKLTAKCVSMCLFFGLQLLFQRRLHAQTDGYKFSHLDITNGLSDNHINCSFKDGYGFMWFGTTSGLNRFDGYKYKVFKHDPTNPNSLKDNQVLRIDQGPDNKLWLFTHSGLCIYDQVTERFSGKTAAEAAGYKIPTDQIIAVKKGSGDSFWFVTNNKGLYCYLPRNRRTIVYGTSPHSAAILHSNYVTDVTPGRHECLWIVHNDGTIEKLNTRLNEVVQRFKGIAEANRYKPERYSITLDSTDNLWAYFDAAPGGVYLYQTGKSTLLHFSKESATHKLNSNVINSIVQADDGKIWIGTDHGGINVVDPQSLKLTYLLNSEEDANSLSENSVNLYKDDLGVIWAGAYKRGVSYYHSGIMQFPLYRHYIADKNSLPYKDINCFAEDTIGNLWIGTNGGGLLYFNRRANTYKQYRHDPSNVNTLSNDVVVKLLIDHQHKLWIGSYFGGLDSFDGNKFSHHRHNDNIPASITDDRVYSIIEDAERRLWVGTFAGGLNIYNPATDAFTHPRYPFVSQYTAIIYEDKQHNIWIGRDKGVDEIVKGLNITRHYVNKPGDANTLVANDVNTLIQDSRGLMWIGTKDGISILDPATNKFLNVANEIPLPSEDISNFLEDKHGSVWISTTNGLVNVHIERHGANYNFKTSNFNELNGLQARGFNVNASLKLKSGELALGGSQGFNIFDPEKINSLKPHLNLVFTDFQLFNKSVAAGDSINGNAILKKSIAETRSITLSHNENMFSIEFALCDYFNPDKIKYEYMLEGFDKAWITSPVNDRKATYTNLDGGDYTFKVRAQNTNGVQQAGLIKLRIKVLPPFWKSPWAYLAYILIAGGLVLSLRHRGITKLKREFQATQEKMEAERKIRSEREESMRRHQLDLIKIKFFTNVSHDFRTPLTLILSPIEQLMKSIDQPDQQHHLLMIKRNGKRLLNMVNQLLDFRKMEYKELKLCLKQADIIKFIKEVYSSFTDVAHQNSIEYIFESDTCSFVTDFDHDKIERILFNLLSNAFKFTPAGGHISVLLAIADSAAGTTPNKSLEIKIIDTGIGISKENQQKVFECYFQDDVPASLQNQGNGIGLSITAEFIKMHGGSILMESEPGYGTCLTINIPVGAESRGALVKRTKEQVTAIGGDTTNKSVNAAAAKKPVLLIIEDNDDLRFYLKDNLKQAFHVIEAVNGKDGWQKALALHPQLIVSDINMPEMNGVELCRKIREDERTCRIPVILLTALADEKDQLNGLSSGANDYMVKPFNFEILLSKINNQLKMQQTLKKTYQKQVDVNAREIVVVSEDDKFLKNAFNLIETNIANPNFSVEELSRHLNVSRVSLYKKLLALTGKTPVDCIRTIRLKRAVQLLDKSKMSIANVGYEVGFNNPAYFAKVFREEYGILPSEHIAETRRKEKQDVLI